MFERNPIKIREKITHRQNLKGNQSAILLSRSLAKIAFRTNFAAVVRSFSRQISSELFRKTPVTVVNHESILINDATASGASENRQFLPTSQWNFKGLFIWIFQRSKDYNCPMTHHTKCLVHVTIKEISTSLIIRFARDA